MGLDCRSSKLEIWDKLQNCKALQREVRSTLLVNKIVDGTTILIHQLVRSNGPTMKNCSLYKLIKH